MATHSIGKLKFNLSRQGLAWRVGDGETHRLFGGAKADADAQDYEQDMTPGADSDFQDDYSAPDGGYDEDYSDDRDQDYDDYSGGEDYPDDDYAEGDDYEIGRAHV